MNAILALAVIVVMELPVLTASVGSSGPEVSAFFDDFNGNQLGQGWFVENLGGSYNVRSSLLTLSTAGPAVTVYRSFVPQTDNFTVSARIESSELAAFALRLQASAPPIFGSTAGAQLEFDTGQVENKNFLAAWEPSGGGWTWSTFYNPSAVNTSYVLELKVQRNPFTIIYNVYEDMMHMNGLDDQGDPNRAPGELLGTYTTTTMGFTYDSISYVALEAWSAPLSYSIDWLKITTSANTLLFDNFAFGRPRAQDPTALSTWAGEGQWNLNNVNGSTVWFPNNNFARFSNFQFAWPPAVSLVSKGNWNVQPRLVLLMRARLLDFLNTSENGGWQLSLGWGSGSAVIGNGYVSATSARPARQGIFVGGECTENYPSSVLSSNDNFLGQWLTANITLDGPTQTMYFSIYDQNGSLIGQVASTGYCGTMFGAFPVNVTFEITFGQADADWISLST